MRKVAWAVSVLFLLGILTGCTQKYIGPSGQIERAFFLQRGIMLQVVHTCTGRARLYQAGGVVIDLIGATPRNIPLGPAIFGDDEISVTLQSLDANGNVVRTHAASFYIDQRSTTAVAWIISDSASGWSGRGRVMSCRY